MGIGTDSTTLNGRLSDSRHRKFIFWLFFCIALLCTITNGMISARFRDVVFHFRDIVIPISSMSGCIQTMSVVCCYLMILTDYKKGIKTALFFITASFIGVTRSIIMSRSGAPLPGALNSILFAALAIMIYKQFKISDHLALTDSVTDLPNRHAFDRDLEANIRSRNGGYVVYLHVNGFHDLNANHGRKAGQDASHHRFPGKAV